MSAKNLSPRSFCILGLICVAVIASLLYITVSWEKTLLGTSIALVALVCYIIFKMSDGWMNSVEAEQMKTINHALPPELTATASPFPLYQKALCFSVKDTRLNGATPPLKNI